MGLLAAETRPDIQLKGFDISPPAVAVSDRLLDVSGHRDRVHFAVGDVLNLETSGEPGTYQGIIAAMLAEHLQDPRPLFAVLAHHLSSDGLVFFSTALESAQRDHTLSFTTRASRSKWRRKLVSVSRALSATPATRSPVAVSFHALWV